MINIQLPEKDISEPLKKLDPPIKIIENGRDYDLTLYPSVIEIKTDNMFYFWIGAIFGGLSITLIKLF